MKKNLQIFSVFIVLIFLFCSGTEERNRETMIISTSWLADHLLDKNLVLLQIDQEQNYNEAHIPGAQYFNFDLLTRSKSDEKDLRLQLPSGSYLDSLFESFGISDDSRIVLYFGTDWASATTRVYFTLDYAGLGDQTSVLNGGLPAWKRENRPVTSERKSNLVKGNLNLTTREEIVAQANWINQNLKNSSFTIIDARNAEYYQGTKETRYADRPGHILGAKNLPFNSILDKNLYFKTRQELQEMFAKIGFKPENLMVVYCHIGQQASLLYFAAKYLGFNVKLFDGSFQEWSRNVAFPVE